MACAKILCAWKPLSAMNTKIVPLHGVFLSISSHNATNSFLFLHGLDGRVGINFVEQVIHRNKAHLIIAFFGAAR